MKRWSSPLGQHGSWPNQRRREKEGLLNYRRTPTAQSATLRNKRIYLLSAFK